MNTIKSTNILIIFFFSLAIINAQEEDKNKKIQTETFHVDGVCNECKTRIENAALIKGVKMVEWSKSTNTLKVVYKHEKVSIEEIHEAVAEAGHDTDKVKAKDEDYNKLPACCAYRDGVEIH